MAVRLPIMALTLAALAVGVSAVPGEAQQAPASDAGPEVPDIRYGIVEPPVVMQQEFSIRSPNMHGEEPPIGMRSIVVAAPRRLIVLSHRHSEQLFAAPMHESLLRIPPLKAYPSTRDAKLGLEDPQSMVMLGPTSDQPLWSIYIMATMSNDALAQARSRRLAMTRLRLDPHVMSVKHVATLSTEPLRRQIEDAFRKLGVEPYRTYHSEAPGEDKNTVRWASVDGITFVPRAETEATHASSDTPVAAPPLLLGFRFPLHQNRAIVAVVTDVDEAFDRQNDGLLKLTDVFTIDLGDRGISAIAWDPVTRGYLIAGLKNTGPWTDPVLPFRPAAPEAAVFWWTGHKDDRPVVIATSDMRLEAICRLPDTPYILIGADHPDRNSGRPYQPPTITAMEFTGLPRP